MSVTVCDALGSVVILPALPASEWTLGGDEFHNTVIDLLAG
jgi:hypothetical protein